MKASMPLVRINGKADTGLMHPYMASQLNQRRESELRRSAEVHRQLAERSPHPAASNTRASIFQRTRAAVAADIKRLGASLGRRPPKVAPAADPSV